MKLAHLVLLLFPVAAGIAAAFQPGVNARFASFSTSRLHAGLLNFAVGLLAMTVVCAAARTPAPSTQKLSQAPWWAFVGGVLGAFFVTTAVYLVPKLGGVHYLVALILGQLVAYCVIDHYGLMGLATHAFTWGRALGLALIVAGVVCVRLM
jgi:transporter family-2 protein